MISSEWGYSSRFGSNFSTERQAEYAVRQNLINIANGANLLIWYDWKNDGTNPLDNESNFGTVTRDQKHKPAYEVIQSIAHQLSGYHEVKFMTLEEVATKSPVYFEFFESNTWKNKRPIHTILVAWSDEESSKTAIFYGGKALTVGPMPQIVPIKFQDIKK